jgi:hypothetical protein
MTDAQTRSTVEAMVEALELAAREAGANDPAVFEDAAREGRALLSSLPSGEGAAPQPPAAPLSRFDPKESLGAQPPAEIAAYLRSIGDHEAAAQIDAALAAPQPPAAPTEPLRKALEQIAKPGYGLELGDSDDARADYWHGQTEMCRRIARAALAASAEQPKPEGALEALRSWADTHRLSDVSSDWDAGYEAARAFVKTQFDVVGQPKPLSDEEIDAVVEQFYMKLKGWDYGGTQVIEVNGYTEYGFARAIERAVLSRIQGSEK